MNNTTNNDFDWEKEECMTKSKLLDIRLALKTSYMSRLQMILQEKRLKKLERLLTMLLMDLLKKIT